MDNEMMSALGEMGDSMTGQRMLDLAFVLVSSSCLGRARTCLTHLRAQDCTGVRAHSLSQWASLLSKSTVHGQLYRLCDPGPHRVLLSSHLSSDEPAQNIELICDQIVNSGKLASPECLRIALIAFRDHPPQGASPISHI